MDIWILPIEEAIANGYACDCVESPVPGCTDDEAINYNPNANQSDNSCEYNCDELGLSTIFINVYGGQYPSEITWSILDSNEDVLIADGVPDMPMQYCLDPNLCYTLLMNDSYGDGWNGNILEITGEQYNNQYTLDNGWFGISLIGDSCDPLVDPVDDCTDEEACNYNANAIDDDGSCLYADDFYDCSGICLADADGDGVCDELEVVGCTDIFSSNYNPLATENDDSCVFINTGVTHGITISSAAVDGQALTSGSVIGVFYDGDNNPTTTDWVCGGSVIWESGSSAFISAMRDDPLTTNKDGFNVGEEFHFIILSEDNNCDYADASTLIWSTDPMWNSGSAFTVSGMSLD